MINNFPFFRGPFYRYPRYYSNTNRNFYKHSENSSTDVINHHDNSNDIYNEKKSNSYDNIIDQKTNDRNFNLNDQKVNSSKYFSLGPLFINTNGFFDKNQPVANISGLKIYLDDIIIVSLIYILYKEDVKDDVLFLSLLLLLIS